MDKIEGIILDWAGTTVDFGCFAPVRVFLQIFQAAGIAVTVAEAREPMGMLKKDHIKAMLAMPRIEALWLNRHGRPPQEEDVEALYASFEPLLMESLATYTQPLPDVVDTVKTLRDRGLKIGSTTGYTDQMMALVTAEAKKNGYAPDFWITPESTGGQGRPYPYMIFRNMEALGLKTPWSVVKVGDTASDIREGVNAGVWSVGVIVGSSQLGLSQDEFYALSEGEQEQVMMAAARAFQTAGADFTIATLKELPALVSRIDTLLQRGKKPGCR